MPPLIQYKFIPEGTIPEHIAPDCFYVDVGSIVHPQVFDHNVENKDAPAAALWRVHGEIRTQCKDIDQLTIFTHQQPDWNACWAISLMEWVLEGRDLDKDKIQALTTYSSFILTGFNPSDGPVENSAMAVYGTLMAVIEEDQQDPYQRDLQKIIKGREFFQFCYDSIKDYPSLKSGDFLTEDGPYGRAMLTVKEDYHTYLHDLSKAYRFTAQLKRKSGQVDRVDGLKMEPPTSRLFKFWARSDKEHSFFKAGFPILWVHWEAQRWIISVNPTSAYNLKGLGDLLTDEENRVAPPDKSKPNRDGYSCPNPWYDARNTLNSHTIVDSPGGGTKIPPAKVEKLLKKFFKIKKKRSAIEKPSWLKDTFIPYGLPLFAMLVVVVFGWILWGGMNQGCEPLRNLADLEINKGRHVAIAIGVNDYDDDKWPDLTTAVDDARDVLNTLNSQYRFVKQGGDGGSVLMVSGGKIPPTFANIKNKIETTAKKLGNNDSLLIYFAGHGQGRKNDTFGCWFPSDDNSGAQCIENSWLQRVVEKSQARHVLIIADCCYAGKLFDSGTDRGKAITWGKRKVSKAPDNLQALYNLASRQGLTSGNLSPVPDGTGHSPFANAMLEFLSGNNGQYLSVGMLHNGIARTLSQKGSIQKPYLYAIEETCDQQGEFVFQRK